MIKELAWGHPVQVLGHGMGRWGSLQVEAALLRAVCVFTPSALHFPGELFQKPREPDREQKRHFGLEHLFPMTHPHCVDCS